MFPGRIHVPWMQLQGMRVDRAPGDWLSSICQASGGGPSEVLQLSASGGPSDPGCVV